MELTKKQLILIAAISGAILLLTVAAVLISSSLDGAASVAPTASPTQTASPTATPEPTVTPVPTAFRLPLVPQWDTPRPTVDMAGAFVPQPTASAPDPPGDGSGPWVEGQGEHTQDILAVGLREGRAAALLMLRLTEGTLTITALPLDETPLVGKDIQEQGAQAAARAVTAGRRCGGWMALDLTCLPAVLEITGGKGQWAILSSSSVSVNQNLWTERMRDVMKEEAYKDLELLEIAYGNDQFQTAYDQTKALIQNYPDLEVICVPTAGGIAAAAKAAADSGTDIKVTGFGLPSEMAEYVGNVCPFFYLWNPVDLGNLTAYVSVALHQDKITGALNEKFKAGDLGEYEVTAAADGGTEVILEHPLRFDQENIRKWADVF